MKKHTTRLIGYIVFVVSIVLFFGCSDNEESAKISDVGVSSSEMTSSSNFSTFSSESALSSSESLLSSSTMATSSSATSENIDNLPTATRYYAMPEDFKQASDIDNIWQNDTVMTYEFLPHGGFLGDGVFKATPASGTDQANTGWNILGITQADHSRAPLFVSALYYFSPEWVAVIGEGVKNIDFQLYDPEPGVENHANTRIVSGIYGREDWPSFDGRVGTHVELNRGGAGWHYSGNAKTSLLDKTDTGLFLEDVSGMWFWMAYYIDFENNRVSAYVKTGPNGPYPEVTRILHRTNNSLLLGTNLHDHAWVKGEIVTGQTSGATARVENVGYDGLIVTPISGNFVDAYDGQYHGVAGEYLVGSQSGAWNQAVYADNWNWDRTSGGLNAGAARNILGYWKVDANTPKTSEMYHMLDQVAVGNGWIDPPF
jgi:hypothetical protein